MTTNILKAIYNILTSDKRELKKVYKSLNRANNMGDALEEYIKDSFCNTIGESNISLIKERYSDEFSYYGNQNNPPDFIIKNSDAVEVKKLDGIASTIQLNSSHPKNKLYSNDTRIIQSCRNCENENGGWIEKDILYVIGITPKEKIKALWFIYGDCFAAGKDIYSRISDKITEGLNDIPDIVLKETNELGGVESIDPLGITYLRIRGMWIIKNPIDIFKDVIDKTEIKNSEFSVISIMKKEKYDSFNQDDRNNIEGLDGIFVDDIRIQFPDNPARLMDCKLIKHVG
ncbi:MAG: restriction endonuclease [Alphaproteobacteria bacterium CG11_big_fil_rev_8_21_14_0_20_39_49]|nr:MAG: restriction endonuclease [Alphaproteobacteria bacterium CG11_big_fil_rev_8_21_14_0_20_39_49]